MLRALRAAKFQTRTNRNDGNEQESCVQMRFDEEEGRPASGCWVAAIAGFALVAVAAAWFVWRSLR